MSFCWVLASEKNASFVTFAFSLFSFFFFLSDHLVQFNLQIEPICVIFAFLSLQMFQFETLLLQISHLELEVLELVTNQFLHLLVDLFSVVLGCALYILSCFAICLRHKMHHFLSQASMKPRCLPCFRDLRERGRRKLFELSWVNKVSIVSRFEQILEVIERLDAVELIFLEVTENIQRRKKLVIRDRRTFHFNNKSNHPLLNP